MENENPTQPTAAQKPKSWWSARRVCVVFILLFGVTFAASWWFTPIEPYASLNLRDECGPLLFSPDGTMLVTSGKKDFGRSAGPLRVWDAVQGQERFAIANNWKAIETVHFSPNSDFLAAHEMEGDLKLWNTRTGEEIACLKPETKFTNWVNFQFSPDGRFLFYQDYSKGWANNKDYITFWNIQSKQEQGSVESYFHTLAFAPDGNTFASFRRKDLGDVNEVLLWKMDQVPVLEMQHSITARYVAFSSILKTFATADDLPDGNGLVSIWDMRTGEKRWSVTFKEHGTHLQSLFFTANDKILAVYGGGGTQLNWHWRRTLWDVTSTPKEIGSFSEAPAVSPDGEWLAIPLDSGAKLIRTTAPERGTDLVVNGDNGPPAFVTYNNMKSWPTPSFSPDSTMILVEGLHRFGKKRFLGTMLPDYLNPFPAGPSGAVVRVWDTNSHQELLNLGNCNVTMFSPDGLILATLRDNQALDLWKVPFRVSVWRVFGWAVIVWMFLVAVGWLGSKSRRKRRSSI